MAKRFRSLEERGVHIQSLCKKSEVIQFESISIVIAVVIAGRLLCKLLIITVLFNSFPQTFVNEELP